MNNLKELKTGLDWRWVAKTPNGKYIKDWQVADLKSHRYDKTKKEKDQDTINGILTIPAYGKEDKEAYNKFIDLLKTKKNFSDIQIQRLNISCVPLKSLKNIKEQKQLRLDIDEDTANLASDIIYYFEQLGDFQLKQNIDTIDVFDSNNKEQICEILFWNKKYSIFVDDCQYYYIGRTLKEFEKDFDEIYECYAKEVYGDNNYWSDIDYYSEPEELLEYTKVSKGKNNKDKAMQSGLYYRLLDAGYSEENENLRFNPENKIF